MSSGKTLFEEEVPDNWNLMDDQEKEAWAREAFFSSFSWSFCEEE